MESNETSESPEVLKSFFITVSYPEAVPGYPVMSLLNEGGGYFK